MTSLNQLIVRVPHVLADAVSDWLEVIAEAVTIDIDDDTIKVGGIFLQPYDDVLIRQKLAEICGHENVIYDWQQIPATDWLAHTARVGAGKIGQFALLKEEDVACRLLVTKHLYIDAAHAFGDGFHATTQGCLLAMQYLAHRRKLHSIFDVGCGTGVLALAAHKLWPKARLKAGDIDAAAVALTKSNAARNRGQGRLHVVQAVGMRHRAFLPFGKADLVLANILAGPLRTIAKDVGSAACQGGCAILSGMLLEQQRSVLAAYRQQGFKLVKSYTINGWVTMLLQKGTGYGA